MEKVLRKDAYTQKQITYLKKIAERTGRSNQEITKMFNKKFNQNRTVNGIVAAKSSHGIKSCIKVYTEEHLGYLREVVPGRTHKETTKMFNDRFNDNRTESSIKSISHESGIKTGNTGRYKPGDLPVNTVPVGTEVARDEGYIWVKVEDPNSWEQKHHIVWEKINGPVPEGHVLLFGDKNKENFDIDNLILASKAQLLQLNRYDLIKEDADLTRTGTIMADIYLKIGERKKTNKTEPRS